MANVLKIAIVGVGVRLILNRGAGFSQFNHAGGQIASWPKYAREVLRWKSQDGAEIEGVLHKPADMVNGRRYPLLIVIHGGPTGISRPNEVMVYWLPMALVSMCHGLFHSSVGGRVRM